MQLTVATYNVHRAIGVDGRQDPLRIADQIASLDAEVVALQEVETPAHPEARALLLRLRGLGFELVPGHTMRRGAYDYGNLLASRLGVISRRFMDLSQPGREPRGLIDAELSLGLTNGATPPLRCLVTHLGLRGWERRQQIARIKTVVEASPAIQQAHTLLLGDFNEWLAGHGRLAALHRLLTPAPRCRSFPSRFPLLPLDRIWYGHGLELMALEVVRTQSAKTASDHLPVLARLRLSLQTLAADAEEGASWRAACPTAHSDRVGPLVTSRESPAAGAH